MDFPEEMIVELLIRLPLKSVIKSKCVSKGWNKLISGNEFRRWYQSRHHNTCPTGFIYHNVISYYTGFGIEPAKFVCTSNIDREELDLFHDLQEFGEVVGSSRGLLLVSLNWTSFYVHDLLTKKNVMLPETFKDHTQVLFGFISKEREQNCSENLIGNGPYLTYKVVFVRKHDINKLSSKYEVETYSSESGNWHKSMMTAASEFSLSYYNTAVIGGVLYCSDYYGETIIAYDPEDPSGWAKLIKSPIWDIRGGLTMSGTREGLLQCINQQICNDIDVWVLRRKHEGESYLDEEFIDRSRWTLIHKLGFMELGQSLLDFQPIGLEDCFFEHVSLHTQDSSVIYLRIFMTNEFLSYNLKEKRVETVISKGEGEGIFTYIINFEWPTWPCLQ